MEFGIFNAACVLPRYVEQHGASAEHDRIMDEVAFIVAADKAGFKYTWASEHHFLTEYSHLSASESFLAFVAAKTSNIHIGSGIFNITPPVNHPARIAERVAMLDHLSEGRFEFGTGRGSSTTEQRGFGIEDPDLTREMVAETLPQIVRMWKDEDYSYDGKFFSMPTPQRAAQALLQAAPGHLDGGRQPLHLRPGRRARRGRAVLRLLDARPAHPAGQPLQGEDRGLHEPGGRLREQQRDDHDADDLHGGRRQGAQDLPRGRLQLPPEPGLPVPRHVPQASRASPSGPRSSPPWTRPRSTPPSRSGDIAVGTPDEVGKAVESFVATGADQLSFGMLSTSMPIEACEEAVETFGKHVLKDFDKDPVHLTTKQRLAAGGS